MEATETDRREADELRKKVLARKQIYLREKRASSATTDVPDAPGAGPDPGEESTGDLSHVGGTRNWRRVCIHPKG